MDVTDLSHQDCIDLINQVEMNLNAVINFTIAKGDDISRQDIAAMLILLLNSIQSQQKEKMLTKLECRLQLSLKVVYETRSMQAEK